jgi:hypothetical protein
MHTVLMTPTFATQAERAGLDEDELREIEWTLSQNPKAGDLMPGTGGLRKVRFKRRGGGKRGGYRTIHYYGGDDVPLFLLALIDKGREPDLSQAAKNEFRKRLPKMITDYRESTRRKVRPLRR